MSTPGFLILVVCLWATAPALHGQTAKQRPTAEELVHAELLTDATDFSHPFVVGIRFSIDPGWNLYWRNPGDAGLPISITWHLPKGFSADSLKLPTPVKLVHDDVIAFGYTDEVVLFCRMTPPDGYSAQKPVSIRADLDYLVCNESCLRGKASVELTPGTQAASPGNHSLFEKYMTRLPRTTNAMIAAGVPFVKNQSIVTIPLRGTAVGTIVDFYPEQIPDFVIDHSSIHVRDGAIQFRVTPYDEEATIKEIRGLLIAGNVGYAVALRIPETQ